jgi:hypothetical protein
MHMDVDYKCPYLDGKCQLEGSLEDRDECKNEYEMCPVFKRYKLELNEARQWDWWLNRPV